MSDSIDVLKRLALLIRNATMDGENTAERVGRTLVGIIEHLNDVSLDELYNIFLRKDKADSTQYLLTLYAGAVFGKEGFVSGLSGFGAKIDENGNGEMRGLTLWEWLQVPELRYNRVEVYLGIRWNTPGAGIILTCTPDTDDEGNTLSTGTCTLKLEDGEMGAVSNDDIAMGIYHFGNGLDATGDSDDSKGNFKFAGFATSYFRITGVSGNSNDTFTYSLRPGYTVHPQPQMHFSCYGNFTNTSRQSSMYQTRDYMRMIVGQNTWEIGAANIRFQIGDLTNLNIHGLSASGYGMYGTNVFFTGEVTQLKPDGTPIMTANDRGAWKSGHYDYYDRVSHDGCIWLCVNEDGTTSVPSRNNPDWLLQVDKGQDGQDGTSFRILGSKNDPSELPQDNNQEGDGYLIDGHLWVWSGTEWSDAGNIQGPAGKSVQNMGGWYSGLHVPYLGVVRMGNASFMCTVKAGTDNPPYWTLTDKDGNRLVKRDGGYLLTGEMNTAEYQLIAADGVNGEQGPEGVPGTDGKDGKTLYTWIRYADDAQGTGITNDPSGKEYIGFAYNKESQLESNDPEDYTWSLIKGTDGQPGPKGEDGTQYWTWIAYSDNADGNPMYQLPTSSTKYIGIAVNKLTQEEGTDPSEYTWSLFKGNKGDKGDKGDQGDGYTHMGQWKSGMVVPYMGVVTMGGSSFVAKVATTNPPLFTLTDKDGNRLTDKNGNYLLTGETNTAEYDVLAERGQNGLDGLQGGKGEQGIPGEKGADGKTTYFHIKYSANENGNPMSDTPNVYIGTYVDFTQEDSTDYTKYAWARFQGIQGDKGEQGIPGYNGEDGKTYYLHIKYSDDGGKTFTGNNGEDTGDYIGVRTDLNASDSNTPSDYKWSKIKGDGYMQMGKWKSGMAVPYMGVVTMGGNSFVAKKATSNPPMYTLTDKSGNRLTDKNGNYLLTGEINTAEYDILAEKGDTGEPGKDGEKGDKGDQGLQGIDGCVIRTSEWATGVEYHNDSNITDGSLPTRYIDVALVRNDSTATGWDAYRCLRTHESNSSITYTNTSYWQKFATNTTAIFTSLIIAKNAKITFLQGNQLLVQKSDGTVTAGLSGSESGAKVRIWVGSPTPDTAPFRVDEYGNLTSNKANITGTINATSGNIGGFTIGNGYIGANSTAGGSGGSLSINDSFIRTGSTSCYAFIGSRVFPASMGGMYTSAGRFENHESNSLSGHFGIYISVDGAKGYDDTPSYGNHALYIPKGDLCGVRFRTRRIGSSTSITVYDTFIIAIRAGITITLPSAPEDGQFYFITNRSAGGITIACANKLMVYNDTSKVSSVGLAMGKAAFVYYDIVNAAYNCSWLGNFDS